MKGLIGFLPSKICCGGFSLQSHIEDGCYQTWVVMILLLFCLGSKWPQFPFAPMANLPDFMEFFRVLGLWVILAG